MKKLKNSWEYEIGEFDQYLFGQGTHYEIYKKLGAHPACQDGVDGVCFAVWAPEAKSVAVVGDFNDWQQESHVMERKEPLGIYVIFVPGSKVGDCYKYCIQTKKDTYILKADPFANYAQLRPETASRVTSIEDLKWSDTKWLEKRATWNNMEEPMAIYEVHIGSWMRHLREDEGYYTYREFAHSVVTYMKDMNYTHLELIGIAEHPFDGSWGYQVTGYYAPTSRYGTIDDFVYMVNYLHRHKIGIILDWVPAHFTRDAHGLGDFDGSPLYEYADSRKGEHKDWGTKVFDYSKAEVVNFLIANAIFWTEHLHIDALRVDAVSSMLYLNYGRNDGEWVANIHGGKENLEVIEFFKHLNSILHARVPGVLMIAEESTAWPKICESAENGGLGFDLKWNMGWMHDFLEYMKLDPYFRKENHYKMTFAMTYTYSENYVLVLSHDEVVHMKCSMVNKMPGLGVDKFRNLMVGYAFMMGHPGKKLLFMGQDFGQLREWSEERELDWFLLQEDNHEHMQAFTRDLLELYSKKKALYEMDHVPEGFRWINADDKYRSIYSFIRYSKSGKKNLLFICNFTPMERPDYCVGVPKGKQYKLLLNSDDMKYGGSGAEKALTYRARKGECDGMEYYFEYPLPAYGVAVFEF